MRQVFDDVARIPDRSDNVAIASVRLEAGAIIEHGDRRYRISHTVLEGHRFAIADVARGELLRSWKLPFGTALRDIRPGDYVCNEKILAALTERHIDFLLPKSANFENRYERYELDESAVTIGPQVQRYDSPRSFQGYARGGVRGVGTRNFIVVLGTSSLAASVARTVADRFREVPKRYVNIDGVVAVAHTEGGAPPCNNRSWVLRALGGFVTHPNVGAVLAVDFGDEPINNRVLAKFMRERGYPLDGPEGVVHGFISLRDEAGVEAANEAAAGHISKWLAPVNEAKRSSQPIEHLKLALQCGGSDAFSGVSANPLAGWVAKETIRHGGSANLAETDELIGAEHYILRTVRDRATARSFLEKIETFRRRAALHGHSAEGNPSGGNNFRGLYNIAIKSIGAARKKDPEVRLDYVIDYGQPMDQPGFYFMDSPGNDLESVAGQVASGANVIIFTTGNGSITNFPFVPTIKVISTTNRYRLTPNEMDVNAGRYQDGVPMPQLGAETFDLVLRTASGRRSVGEKAGHGQVQLWRDWRQTESSRHVATQKAAKPKGKPLSVKPVIGTAQTFEGFRTRGGFAIDQVGVVVPTSLCSGQIAKLIVERMNERRLHRPAVSQYVTFVHTEGCGASGGDGMQMFLRTLVGHVRHPMVRCGLFLEHGCEITHNDAFRNFLADAGCDPQEYGWASVQLDGGIESVTDCVIGWFDQTLGNADARPIEDARIEELAIGLTTVGEVPVASARVLAEFSRIIVGLGGTVIVAENASLLTCSAFTGGVLTSPIKCTLEYAERPQCRGFHVMQTPTQHEAETLSGLGATGVGLMLAHTSHRPFQAHPMIPLLQLASRDLPDIDCVIDTIAEPDVGAQTLLDLVLDVASRRYTPKLFGRGYCDFQITRGLLGVSL